jgi:hypothetical protein
MGIGIFRLLSTKNSGRRALTCAAIRRGYAIPDFFDTCARVWAERNVAVSIGSICQPARNWRTGSPYSSP